MVVALLIIMLGGITLFALSKATTAPPPVAPVAKAITAAKIDEMFAKSRHQKGDMSAALTLVEFADFECPSCRTAYNNTLKTELKTLPSYRIGFFNYPIPQHQRAVPAALAAEAAAKQGKFWEMYAELFDKKSDGLDEKAIAAAAQRIGLDLPRFAADRKDDKPLKALINSDVSHAADNQVDATPTFFIHDKAGNAAVLAGASNFARIFPDLKNGVIGDDTIAPPDPEKGTVITVYIGGKRESR